MEAGHIPVIPKLWLPVAVALALLPLGHGYGAEWPVPPPGQPAQIRSQVNYDPKLSDPFFESDEWSYPWWIIKHGDGTIENTAGGPTDEKELPHLKHTARCFTSFQGEHWIKFCNAKLLDADTIEHCIHDGDEANSDNLRIVVQKGVFWSQYWTVYKRIIRGHEGATWTTTKQELTLDKKVYRQGDVIKGRIVFECVEEATNPLPGHQIHAEIIKVEGVFKSILE
jgi:hypothetical protein